MKGNRNYVLNFESATSVFTGMGVAGLVDRFVIRDASEQPIIPGSTVKGRWRFFTERLVRSIDESQFTVHASHKSFCTHNDELCTVCSLFGSPLGQARIAVGPAAAVDQAIFEKQEGMPARSAAQATLSVRPGVALSRRTRTALAKHLFFDEVVPPTKFGGTVRLLDEISDENWQLLRCAARLVDAMGARKNVGRGRLAAGIELEA